MSSNASQCLKTLVADDSSKDSSIWKNPSGTRGIHRVIGAALEGVAPFSYRVWKEIPTHGRDTQVFSTTGCVSKAVTSPPEFRHYAWRASSLSTREVPHRIRGAANPLERKGRAHPLAAPSVGVRWRATPRPPKGSVDGIGAQRHSVKSHSGSAIGATATHGAAAASVATPRRGPRGSRQELVHSLLHGGVVRPEAPPAVLAAPAVVPDHRACEGVHVNGLGARLRPDT